MLHCVSALVRIGVDCEFAMCEGWMGFVAACRGLYCFAFVASVRLPGEEGLVVLAPYVACGLIYTWLSPMESWYGELETEANECSTSE